MTAKTRIGGPDLQAIGCRCHKGIDMQKRWINGEEYWLYDGQWVPRGHFYDYGEEPLYLGPIHRRRLSGWRACLAGFAACCPVFWFVIGKLLGH